MEFLRPGLLLGLLSVGVPILIHLLGRRRVRTIPIATLRFLERARVRASTRLKLRRILLLLARMTALACLAFLYAGPGCRTAGSEAPGSATWVLVLDTSPSMGAARSGRSRLEEAKTALGSVLASAGPEDRFLFATSLDGDGAQWRRGFVADPSRIRNAVAEAGTTYGRHRVDQALESAFALLDGVPRGRVVLATDLQASAWGDGRLAGAGTAPLRLLDVGLPAPRNTWVDAIDEVGGGEGGVRVRLGAAGTGRGQRRTVHLFFDEGRKLTAFAEKNEILFQERPPATAYVGRVQVEPGGDLADDDELAFVGRGRSRIRVLIVNGDPRGFEIRDEALFVRRALAPGTDMGRDFEVREIRLGDLGSEDIEEAQLLVVANPGPFTHEISEALLQRVREGAGLIVTAGDRWERSGEVAGGSPSEVLAAPLRDVVVVPPDDPSRPPYERLDASTFDGPVALFKDREVGDLSDAQIRKYWVLDARTGEGVNVWMRLENGVPLLVERRIGKGRSLLLATTVDRDGADLCLQPVFIPWLERLLLHAAGRLRPALDRWATAGRPVEFPYREPVFVEGPEGRKTLWQPDSPPYVPATPGVYRVTSEGELVGSFVARIHPDESDLTRLAGEDLDAVLGKENYSTSASEAESRGVAPSRKDLSTWFAVALLAAVCVEAALSTRWVRRRKTQILEA